MTHCLPLDAAKEDAIGSFKEKNPINIAKSLPMDIPVFMSSFQNHLQEDADDSLVSVKSHNRKFTPCFVCHCGPVNMQIFFAAKQ